MVGEWMRNWGFWIVDMVRGGSIRRQYLDIHSMMQTRGDSSEQNYGALEKLLDYATNNSQFYSAYRDLSINEFPIIDKNIIRTNSESILVPQYDKERLHKMSTSGSTGTPFTIYQNQEKRNRVLAEIVYFGKLCGYEIGDRNAFIRTWTMLNRKNALSAFLQNLVMIDNSRLDEENLEAIRDMLTSDKKLRCILGYASSLDVISRYLIQKGDKPDSFGVKVVISSAEVLSETTRENLKEVFGCTVVSRYSNQENGIIAQELADNLFVINRASYYVEFLKVDSNEHAKPGELSRVVLTDLFNYAMPMIRYDTGDLAIFQEHPQLGRVIVSIEGRVRDFLYDTKGRLVAPSAITVNMWKHDKLKQFQFIQETKTQYILKLNGARGIYNDDEFVRMTKDIMGQDAHVIVDHVDGIPLLSSGKFRQVVCNYEPSDS